MALSSANVRVAVSGEVLIAATSATAPTGTGGTTTGFTGLGYVSEDGVTETRERSVESIKAWQNGANVRDVVTDGTLTFGFTLIESKKETVELFYGVAATQSATEGNVVIVPTATGGRKSFILDVVDGAELIRVYIPEGEVTEVGDIVYASGEPIGYEVTITAYANATLAGSARKWMTALKTP